MIHTYLNIKRTPRGGISGAFYWTTARRGFLSRRKRPNLLLAQPIHRFDFSKIS